MQAQREREVKEAEARKAVIDRLKEVIDEVRSANEGGGGGGGGGGGDGGAGQMGLDLTTESAAVVEAISALEG